MSLIRNKSYNGVWVDGSGIYKVIHTIATKIPVILHLYPLGKRFTPHYSGFPHYLLCDIYGLDAFVSQLGHNPCVSDTPSLFLFIL